MTKRESKITVRLMPDTEKWLAETFERKSPGAEMVLEMAQGLYRRMMRDLKGVFTEEELLLMIDVLNSTLLTPRMAGEHLLADCEDAIKLDGLDGLHGVDPGKFLEKLRGLSPYQVAWLEIWVKAYWWHHEEHGDPREYVESLAGNDRVFFSTEEVAQEVNELASKDPEKSRQLVVSYVMAGLKNWNRADLETPEKRDSVIRIFIDFLFEAGAEISKKEMVAAVRAAIDER